MLAAWPLLIAVVARLPSCSWESGGAVTVAINITGFASPCATDSHSAEKLRSHIPQRGLLGKQRRLPSALLRVCYICISSFSFLARRPSSLPRSISRLQEREVPIPDRRPPWRVRPPARRPCSREATGLQSSSSSSLRYLRYTRDEATLEHRRSPCQRWWQPFGRILRSRRRPSLPTEQQHAGVPEGQRRGRPLQLIRVTEAARRTLTTSVLKDCSNCAHPPELPMQRACALLQWRRSLPSRRPALNASRPKRPGTP